jgi:hypothetical protein
MVNGDTDIGGIFEPSTPTFGPPAGFGQFPVRLFTPTGGAAPTGSRQFSQGDNRFETDRLNINIIKTDPDVAIGQFQRKTSGPLKIITFWSAIEPDDGIRLGKPARFDRLYSRSGSSLIQLIDPNTPPEFREQEITIVSYQITGTAPQIEVGKEFLGWTSPHSVWRFVDDFTTAVNARQSGQRVSSLIVNNRLPLRLQRFASIFTR